MYCYNCGSQLPEEAKFCPYCGTKQNIIAQDALEEENTLSEQDTSLLQEKQKQGEMELFSDMFPTKQAKLFGVSLAFPGSFFIKDDVKESFSDYYQKMAEAAIKKCEDHGPNSPGFVAIMHEEADSWPKRSKVWIASNAMRYGLSGDFCDRVWDEISENIYEFSDRISSLADVFNQLDFHVDQITLEGQINKAFRSRPMVIGQGFGGMINAAISQSLFNAGTGLLHDVKTVLMFRKKRERFLN